MATININRDHLRIMTVEATRQSGNEREEEIIVGRKRSARGDCKPVDEVLASLLPGGLLSRELPAIGERTSGELSFILKFNSRLVPDDDVEVLATC